METQAHRTHPPTVSLKRVVVLDSRGTKLSSLDDEEVTMKKVLRETRASHAAWKKPRAWVGQTWWIQLFKNRFVGLFYGFSNVSDVPKLGMRELGEWTDAHTHQSYLRYLTLKTTKTGVNWLIGTEMPIEWMHRQHGSTI